MTNIEGGLWKKRPVNNIRVYFEVTKCFGQESRKSKGIVLWVIEKRC